MTEAVMNAAVMTFFPNWDDRGCGDRGHDRGHDDRGLGHPGDDLDPKRKCRSAERLTWTAGQLTYTFQISRSVVEG